MGILRLKKWYGDFVSDDGSIVGYTYVMALRLAGIPFGNVAVHVRMPGGQQLRATKTFMIGRKAWGSEPDVGGNTIRNTETGSKLSIALKDIHLSLEYDGPSEQLSQSTNAPLLGDPHCRITWDVLQRSSRVRGTVHIRNEAIAIAGMGYRDLVEMDADPWRIPLHRLLWGRAHCGEYALVFNRVELDDGRVLGAQLLCKEGEIVGDSGIDAKLTIGAHATSQVKGRDFLLTLVDPFILERASVVTSERIRPWFLRRLMMRLSHDPTELKLFARATLAVDGRTFEGYAIHEMVTWA